MTLLNSNLVGVEDRSKLDSSVEKLLYAFGRLNTCSWVYKWTFIGMRSGRDEWDSGVADAFFAKQPLSGM
jgi:hypothetical protein